LVDKGFGILKDGWFSGTNFLVELEESFFGVGGGIFKEGGGDVLVIFIGVDIVKEFLNLSVLRETESSYKGSCGDLTVAIDPDGEMVVARNNNFKPGTTHRADLGLVKGTTRMRIYFTSEVNAGRTNDLIDDHTLNTINDEGAARSHQRKVRKEQFLLFILVGSLVS